MNKKLIISALALSGLAIATTLGVTSVKADDTDHYPPLVQKLVERFNLNQDEVEQFFDEERTQRRELMQQRRGADLDQAVADGVITQDQKQALLDKQQEMFQNREQHHEEMDTWFEEQGIDHEALRQYMGGPKGPGGWGMR